MIFFSSCRNKRLQCYVDGETLKNFFDQPIKYDIITYENIRKLILVR